MAFTERSSPKKEAAAQREPRLPLLRESPFGYSGGSSGAPIPDEPTNSFLPSSNVMSRPLARNEPSFAWKPCTLILVPAGSELRFQPRRSSAFGAPPSTIHFWTSPDGVVTSMWIHECGLIQSIFVTVPSSWTGRFASNSAANEWCPREGAAAAVSSEPMATLKSFMRIAVISVLAKPSNGRTLLVFLHEVSVQELLGKLDTLELEQLNVLVGSTIERQRDRPRALERFGILDRGRV